MLFYKFSLESDINYTDPRRKNNTDEQIKVYGHTQNRSKVCHDTSTL